MENSHEVLEIEVKTLPIRVGYQLIIHDDSVIGGVIVGTFVKALKNNASNETIGVQVAVDGDPDNIKVVLEDDIRTVHHSNGSRTWERIDNGDFVSTMITTRRSLPRMTRNSNQRNREDEEENDDDDSSVEILDTVHTNENVDQEYEPDMIERKKGKKKKKT